jgi:hypothetical protein
MKKSLIIIAAASLVLNGCAGNDTFKEIKQQENSAIGFSTYTSRQTRAENSSETHYDALEAYNNTFRLWGNKYINKGELDTNNQPILTASPVFGFTGEGTSASPYEYPGEKVEFKTTPVSTLIGNWDYTPIRFWDKTATHYDFYAASPFIPKSTTASGTEEKVWNFDNDTKKISLPNFTVSGINRVTTGTGNENAAFGVLTTIDNAAVMSYEQEDLMIATDIPAYKDYGYATYTTGVNLQFNHILSRLNIAIRKKSPELDDYTIKLNSFKIYNMFKNGAFNEADANSTSTPALAEGTIARWTGRTEKFAPGTMIYEPSEALDITSTSAATDGSYQYIYEGLVIPQNVGFSKTVLVNEENKPEGYFLIDGSNAVSSGDGEWSNPYVVIDYEIGTGTGNNYKKVDRYVYYFNLAEIFGATTSAGIDFCEGWQNTVKITLAPVAIKFDAEVAKWDEKFAENSTENPKTGTTFELQ